MRSYTAYNAIVALPMDSYDVKVGILINAERLAAIDFLPFSITVKSADNSIARQVADQLETYISNEKFQFSVPLLLQGTVFQNRVWRALLTTRTGETRSYGHIADQLHSSPRAVGNACRANPIPIVVPCHRIVAKQGFGGYCGQTSGPRMHIKHWLLGHERG
ncbi:methylated-DNA--[protein]-cysteine S-methyltransferase [Kaarinaea lacus]